MFSGEQNIALIGYSEISSDYLRIIGEFKDWKCKYIVTGRNDFYPERVYKKNKIQVVDTISDILSDRSITKVIIATEPSRHLEFIVPLLRRNIDVLVEKPLYNQMNKALFDVIRNTLFECDANLSVVSQLRFDDTMNMIRDKSLLKSPDFISLNFFTSRPKEYYHQGNKWRLTDSSVFLNQAYHWIDILHWCFGPIDEVKFSHSSSKFGISSADTTAASLTFSSGTIANLYATTSTKLKKTDLKIYFNNFVIDYRFERMKNRILKIFKYFNRGSNYCLMKQQVRAFLNGERDKLVDFETAVKILDVVLKLSRMP